MRTIRWMISSLLLLATVPAAAQWGPTGPLFALHEEVARPSMLAQYEAANRDFRQLVVDFKAKLPQFSYLTFQGDDLTYAYLSPIADLNAYAAIGAGFAAVAEAAPARFGEVMARGNGAIESWTDSIIALDPALSYLPAKPRVSLENTLYRHLDIYRLMPGKEAEADAIARDFLALYQARNMPNPYHVYKGVLGGEMPALLVVVPAKDALDFAAAAKSDREALGEAGQALFARAFAITRRFEQRNFTLRPDLSVPAPAR